MWPLAMALGRRRLATTVLAVIVMIPIVTWCRAADSREIDISGQQFPKDLIYDGKPIEPACLPDLWQDSDVKRLTLCPHPPRIIDTAEDEGDRGFIGYREEKSNVYKAYRYIGDIGGLHVVLARADGGGSLHLSTLLVISRNKDIVRATPIEERYGCGRWVNDAAITDRHLRYSCTAWFSELAELSDVYDSDQAMPHRFDLLDSPFSTAQLTFEDGNLQTIHLNTPTVAHSDTCLNKVISRYIANHVADMPYSKLAGFIRDVKKECGE